MILSIGGTFAVHNTSNVDAIRMLAKERADIHVILDEQSVKNGQLSDRVRDALFELRAEITSVVERAETAERERDESASKFKMIRFALNEAGYIIGNTSIVGVVQGIIKEAANVRRILRESGQMDAHPSDDVLDIVERLAQEQKRQSDAEKELADILREMRRITGTVEIDDIDRGGQTAEAYAANPQGINAEHRAMLRVLEDGHRERTAVYDALYRNGLRTSPKLAIDNYDAHDIVSHIAKEFAKIKSLLEQGGQELDGNEIASAVELLVREHLFGTEPKNSEDDEQDAPIQAESPLTTCWCAGPRLDIRVSLPLLRGLTTIIAEPMNGGPPSILTRRHRIIRMYRAILVLASTHGVFLDEHDHEDLNEDGPIFDKT